MIVLRNVWKWYGDDTVALRGVTLTVPHDDFVFLVGPNGAGKTTLLRLLHRAETPSDGCILVNGQDVQDLDEQEVSRFRQRIGVVFQDTRLFPDKTVYENVAVSLRVSGDGRASELVWDALEVVQLADHAERFPGQLSGGEAQRGGPSRGRLSGSHSCCWPMSRPPTSHRLRLGRCSRCSPTSTITTA